MTGHCCNEFTACAQNTECNSFNTCVATKKPNCAGMTDPAQLKTCLTKDCPTGDTPFGLWMTAQGCAGQNCATVCQQ